MGLRDLLNNGTFNQSQTYTLNDGTIFGEAGNSLAGDSTGNPKSIKYDNINKTYEADIPNYHLLNRISWPGRDDNYINHKFEGIQVTHKNFAGHDFILRGGVLAAADRRRLDVRRIGNFLISPKGIQFVAKQIALQALNPQENQRLTNPVLNTLASVGASGLSRFRKAGLAPQTANYSANSEGEQTSKFIKFIKDSLGGNYISLIGQSNTRESKYNLGEPGKRSVSDKLVDLTFNPLDKTVQNRLEGYNIKLDESQYDKLSYQDIFYAEDGTIPINNENTGTIYHEDMCKFRFEVIDSDNPQASYFILFRAFLENLNDNFNATHNEIKYNGRGEHFYTYNSFKRTIAIGFKIAAQSRHEMKPLYRKLNYLAAQTAPNYSSDRGRIRTPYMRLTLGDYFNRLPGVLTSVSVSWQKDYSWEIKHDPKEKDADMKVLPHILDVSINFLPIHDFTPNNSVQSPFIGMDDRRGGEFSNSWLSKKALGDPSTIVETDDDEVVLNDQLYEPNYDRRSQSARLDAFKARYNIES